jgi:hypothetical protein
MLHTVGEAAAGIRQQIPIATVRHSAGGAATLTDPVVAGVHAMRVRVAGAAAAAVAAGVGTGVVAAGGSERVLKNRNTRNHRSEEQNA